MIKLLLCLFSAAVLGFFVLQLRHQQLELGYETAALHEKIKNQQGKLWNQQLQIAEYTAPNAIEKTVKSEQIELVPVFSINRDAPKSSEDDPDAE
jgi:cell division protein FtsL